MAVKYETCDFVYEDGEVCGKRYTHNSMGWHRRREHGIYVRGPKAKAQKTRALKKMEARDAFDIEVSTNWAKSNGKDPNPLDDFEIFTVLRHRRTGQLFTLEKFGA
jgi:hypothetical protein